MEKFIYLMKMTFMTKLAYVKAFWINIAGTFASIVIYYFLWQFVFRQQDSLAGYTAAEMTAYVILSRMLSSQFSGGINYELSNWIRTGMIGTELLRPVSLFFTLFAKRAGEFVFFALFKGAPIALVSFLILGGTAPAGFIGILAIASAVGTMGGWGIYEICLMFSMCAFIESLSQTFFDNVWEINGLVHRGRMDVFLVRPASVFFQLLGDVMHYPALMSMTIYAGVMVFAMVRLEIGFSVGSLLFFGEYLICGIVVNTGIYTIFNSLNFWIVQGEDVAVLVQTCREFAKYPIGAFPGVIRTVFTYVLPFGFVGYYPAAYLTGKAGGWVLAGLPAAAVIVAGAASVVWRIGSRGYNSTGT